MAERLPCAVEERAFLATHGARTRSLDIRSHSQPVLGVDQIAERHERCAAVSGVRGALCQWCARYARLTALEHFVGLDVAAFTVQVRAPLYEVPRAAGSEQ